MAYEHTNAKGIKYYLHSKTVTLRGGRNQNIYYFSKTAGEGAINKIPEGFVVKENPRTGLPVLARKGG